MKIAIVVPVLSNFEGAVKALASVRTRHEWTPFIFPQWKQNKPISHVWNEGIERARNFHYCLVINDDILFSPVTIDRLVYAFTQQNRNVVMLTANNMRGEISPGQIFTYEPSAPSPIDDEWDASFHESPDFSCFMVRPRMILDLVGKFDENFVPAYFEDNDFHRRTQLKGCHAYRVLHAPYYHFGSVTMNAQVSVDPQAVVDFERNRDYYIRKWGGLPGQETYLEEFNGDPPK